MEQEKINIIGVKTAHGFLITIFLGGGRYGNINKYIVNGKQPTGTFLESWGQVDAEPELVEKSVRQPNINHRFVLKDDIHWIDGSTLPKEIPKTEVMEEIDGACEWKDEFKPIQSMYYETSDPQPDRKEEVQFNYKTVLEVDDIKYADGFEYFTQPREYSYKIGNKDINFQDLSKILLPPIALPNSECFLSSKQSYDIIR